MALSAKDLIAKLKRATLDKTDLDERVVNKYNQVNSSYQKVNNPNVRQMYNQLPQRLEPVRRTYNQVQRPVGNTLATLGTVGQSAYQGTRRIVEPLGYSFGTAVRSPWEQSQINRQKQTSQQTSQRLYNQALQARKQGNPELARRLTLQAQGQFTPIINRQRQLGVDQSRFTKPQMVSSTLKTGASALAGSAGLGSLLATSTLGGGLSAGIAKWQGQDPTQAFGTGIAEALPYAFVNKITDPVYGQIANRVLGQATNPLAKIFAKGGTYGLANLVENEITTRMFEGRGATGMEQVFAGGMGVGYGSGSQAFRELKNADFSAISKKLDIPVEKVKLAYQTIVDSYAQMTPAQRQAGFVDPTAKIGRSSQTKPPTDPLEALKVEARKYKSAEEFVRKDKVASKTTHTSGGTKEGNPQSVKIVGDKIVVTNRRHRKVIGKYELPLSEWENLQKSFGNPNYNIKQRIKAINQERFPQNYEDIYNSSFIDRLEDNQISAIKSAYEAHTKRQQLTDLYNQSQLPKSKVKVEARKYKSADEFVDSQANLLHGTKADFTEFDPGLLGTNTGAPSAKKGFFFTDTPEIANHYANPGRNYGTAVSKNLEDSFKNIEARAKAEGLSNSLENNSGAALVVGAWPKVEPGTPKELVIKAVLDKMDSLKTRFDSPQDIAKIERFKQIATEELNKTPITELELFGKVMKSKVDFKNPLVFDDNGFRNGKSYAQRIDEAIEKGHDGVIIKNSQDPLRGNIYIALNKDQILTEKQLTDLYNQSQLPKSKVKVEARKYKTTVNLQDKNDLEYLERIFSKSTIEDILSGQKTNWRGESYEDLARVNFISETPKTIEQQLAGKIKDYKPASDTFYHGTSADSARKIMGEGFKSGTELPKDAYRGGGYGKIQEGVSFAETPKEAGIFSTLTRDGEIVEAKLKKGAKIVTIDGIEDAADLADYTKYLKKQGIDAVYIGGGEKELVVLNTKAVTPVKSQLTDLYNQSQLPKSKVKVEANQPGKLMEANRLDNQALQVDNLTGKSPLVKPLQEQQVPPQSALSPQDLVNTSAKANQLPQTKSQLTKVNQQPGKPTKSQSQPYFNTKNMLISKKAKKVIDKTIAEVKPQIEKATGKKLTNKEVIEKANQSAKVLEGAVGKDQTLAWEASLLKARQKLASLSESGVVDQEYIDALVTVKTHGTDIARKLQSFGIGADPALVTSKQAILEAVLKATDDAEAVLKASKGVDFNDLQQATTFYRKFIKPTNSEWVDLLRYNSMLSSPNTHINNAFSNAQGTGLIAPIEKTIEGSLDAMRSAITGKPRAMFAGEGLEYARGYYSNISTASKRFVDVMRGKQQISNPDTRHIRLAPTGTSSKVESTLNYPMRLLEAADQFFSSLTEGGAKQALEYRAGKMGKSVNSLEEVAQKEAAERLFRSELGDNQGSVALDAIDTVANTVQGLKNSKNPIVSTIAKFTLPFIRTPTNLLKQGVEFSPAGLITLYGAKNKQQLIARSIIGSSVALGTSILLGSDRLTWAEPTGEKQRNKFRAAGLQPYSVKIGNKWISYSKLHPAVSFNIALIAALKDSHDKGDIDDTQLDTVLGGLAKWMNFYADQSYMKNIGDIVSATKGDIYGLSKMVSNYPQQLIPFRALMGWINRIIEPYQRQVNSDAGMLEKQFQYMATQIPGLSGIVPLRMSPDGQPIENQNRLLNAVSPLRVTTQVKDYARPTKGVSLTSTTGSAPISIPTDQETFNELYKKALSNGTDFPTQKALIEADPTLDEAKKAEKIEKLRTETAQWAETLITMQDKYPKQVFGAELKTYGKNSSFNVEERSEWASKQFNTVKDEKELQTMINEMWDSGVLTTGSNGTAEYLKDELGLDVYTYTGKNEKVKKKVSGGSGKKVTLGKAPSIKSVSFTPTRSSIAKINFKTNFKRLNLPETPRTARKKVNLMAMSDKLTKRQSKSII